MTVRVTHTNVCDRCGEAFVFRFPEQTIGHLAYMVKTNGSGSQNSNMSLDLCSPCARLFLNFMKGK